MHNGKDSNDQTNNLTHPAVAELCTNFYYGASSRIGHEYKELFGSEVPPLAVALAIVVIKCCLDEWATGTHTSKSFQADSYRIQYGDVVDSINTVATSTIHCAKFRAARREWASNGIARVSAAPVVQEFRFQVHID
ncbi:hypothetical protein FIBSPDRAFT_114332 [Athelia psychrophila]|uniref:DUF6532 domain-containing protein n=1 Tax=Athelia psychrophila TaxID=1759441 RepID=A0A166D1Z4_9AGAM|nr:hypothetical protein FIBSPDRAFT_114332 [Fibularhizoctonia sp. CBS 109695]